MLRRDTVIFLVTLTLLLLAAKANAGGVAINDWRSTVKPDAIIDLRTRDGAALRGDARTRPARSDYGCPRKCARDCRHRR